MKLKCRILSICVIVALTVAVIVGCVFIAGKNKNKTIYAKSINFNTVSKSIEMYIGNNLLLNDSFVKVTPSNCAFMPEYKITKSSTKEESFINTKFISFTETGKYVLTCQIKRDANNYIHDTINIVVVAIPDETTSMFISKIANPTIRVEDEVQLSDIIEISCPENTKRVVQCSENLTYIDNKLIALSKGEASVEIFITYDNITIFSGFKFNIKAKLDIGNIDLIVTMYDSVISNRQIEVDLIPLGYEINYKITELDNEQTIRCWTDSENIEIISFNAPTIAFKPVNKGSAIIYVSPKDYADIVFEILVNIV